MLSVYGKGVACLVGIVALLVKRFWGIEIVDSEIDKIAELCLGAATVFGVIKVRNAAALVLAAILLGSFSGCALTGASMLSSNDVKEALKLMKAENATGCSIFTASGTPPASRVDLKVKSAWGKMDAAKCLETLDKP